MDYREPEWVAEKLGWEKNTVYRYLHDGVIPAIQLGRKWLISESKLEQWLAEETERQTRARRDAARSADAVSKRMENLTAGARQVVKRAHAEARRYGHAFLDQPHLLLALAEDRESPAGKALAGFGVGVEVIRAHVEANLKSTEGVPARRLARTPEAKRAMRLAGKLAVRDAAGQPLSPVSTSHLLWGVLLSRRGLGYDLLSRHGVTRQKLKEALETKGAQS